MRKAAAMVVLLGCLHCGNSLPFQEENTLKRPLGLSVTAVSPLKFNVTYYVTNQEKTFSGYNLYIARTTMGESETRAGGTYSPLNLDGSLPTFKHSSAEVSTSTAVTKTISVYADGVTGFESGVNYYFRITAYSRTQVESSPSNEASGTALP